MDALTEHEIAAVVRRLEEVVADLEHDIRVRPFYTFILVAQEFAGKKKALFTLEHIRTFVSLAHRMLAIRDGLLPHASRWTPLTDVLAIIHSEAARLTSLYGVARPACGQRRRELQQEFRTSFTHETGKAYHPYGPPRTAKEHATITAFWDDAFGTALASFIHHGEGPTLDRVMACFPAWASCHHGRWSTQGWREPSVREVMYIVQDAMRVCEICTATIAQIAGTVLEQAPVVDRAQITRDVAQQHAAQVQALRDQLSALPLPKDTPKTQHAQLRKAKAQLQHALQALLSAQEATIQRQVNKGSNYRHQLAMLATKASRASDTLLRRVGKASVDVLPRMIWLYEYERRGDDDWLTAKQDARRFFRTMQHARAQAVAGAAP